VEGSSVLLFGDRAKRLLIVAAARGEWSNCQRKLVSLSWDT